MRLFVLCLICCLSSVSLAAETAVTDNGIGIRLYDDGHWAYEMQSGMATTTAGQRIQLFANGQWQAVQTLRESGVAQPVSKVKQSSETVPVSATVPTALPTANQQRNAPSPSPLPSGDIRISLDKLVIESRVIKFMKAKRWERQAVFYLNLELPSGTGTALSLKPVSTGNFTVANSDGDDFPVLAVSSLPETIRPGDKITLELRTRDAPLWHYRKALVLTIAANSLRNPEAMQLSVDMDYAKEKQVDEFPVE